jgi:uncharacterized repeat protein (TIGR03803 family)
MRHNDRKNRLRSWALGFAISLAALALGTGGSASAAPVEKVLYSFCHQTGCSDGNQPVAGLRADSSGNLYGTTQYGGASGSWGVVFKLSPGGVETVLHAFTTFDGAFPEAGLIGDSSGNLYGTTRAGGEVCATFFTRGGPVRHGI